MKNGSASPDSRYPEIHQVVLHPGRRKRLVLDAARLAGGQGDGQKIVVVDPGEIELPLVGGALGNVAGRSPVHVRLLREPAFERATVEHRARQLLEHQPRCLGADAAEPRPPRGRRRPGARRRRHRRVELDDVRVGGRLLEAERLPRPEAGAVLVVEGQHARLGAQAQAVGRRPEQRGVEARRQAGVVAHPHGERPRPGRRDFGQHQLDGVAVLVGVVLELPAHELAAAVVEFRQHEVGLHDDGPGAGVGHDRNGVRRVRRDIDRRRAGDRGRESAGRVDRRPRTRRDGRRPGTGGGGVRRGIRRRLRRERRPEPALIQHQDQEGQRDREQDSTFHDRSDVPSLSRPAGGPAADRRRHCIDPAGMKRMAPGQPAKREPGAAETAVAADGLFGVVRAGRLEAAGPREQRTEDGPVGDQQRRGQTDQPPIRLPDRGRQDLHSALIAAPGPEDAAAGFGGSRSAGHRTRHRETRGKAARRGRSPGSACRRGRVHARGA